MKLSGFSYIRNGLKFYYPFIESILSILPICDEFVIAVGDSEDGTREAIEKINSPKIKIIDTIWDENMRKDGRIFAQQANIALDNTTGDWCFHIQVDEVIHENDLPKIVKVIEENNVNQRVDGFLFHFLNFLGTYQYVRNTRKMHRFEIRVFRNKQNIRSYKDSQGFRLYSSKEAYKQGEIGKKLKVKKIDVSVFHYNYVRPPEQMKQKADYTHRFWHNDEWLKKNTAEEKIFHFDEIDKVVEFKGTHPLVMNNKIKQQNWNCKFDSRKTRFSVTDKLLDIIEKNTGYRIGEYKNYKLIR